MDDSLAGRIGVRPSLDEGYREFAPDGSAFRTHARFDFLRLRLPRGTRGLHPCA